MTPSELEAAVCGMILNDRKLLLEAESAGLTSRSFLDENCVAVMRAYEQAAVGTSAYAVMATLGPQAREAAVTMRQNAPLTLNFAVLLKAQLSRRRQDELHAGLASLSRRLSSRSCLDPIEPIIEELVDLALSSKGEGDAMRGVSMGDALSMALTDLESRLVDHRPVGVPTGFAKLDGAIFGLQPGFMYALGARTGIGKTTLATVIAVNAARSGHKVCIITVEMDAQDLAYKILSRAAMIDMGKMYRAEVGDDDIDRITAVSGDVSKLPIDFVEVYKARFDFLSAEITRRVKVQKAELIIVDYLQLFELPPDQKHRTSREEVKQISSQLKMLARSLHVPILVLSQLNRQAPEYGEPELIHIAESDQLARDSDVVMMLYQATQEGDYYLSVRKNRRGKKGHFMLRANLANNLFEQGTYDNGARLD